MKYFAQYHVFPRYISCYIAENQFSFGQCRERTSYCLPLVLHSLVLIKYCAADNSFYQILGEKACCKIYYSTVQELLRFKIICSDRTSPGDYQNFQAIRIIEGDPSAEPDTVQSCTLYSTREDSCVGQIVSKYFLPSPSQLTSCALLGKTRSKCSPCT